VIVLCFFSPGLGEVEAFACPAVTPIVTAAALAAAAMPAPPIRNLRRDADVSGVISVPVIAHSFLSVPVLPCGSLGG
jgi:hypothetical protein